MAGTCWSEHVEVLRSGGVVVAVRVQERLGVVRLRLVLYLQERRIHPGELPLEFLDEDVSALIHPHELDLCSTNRLLQVVLDHADCLHDLA